MFQNSKNKQKLVFIVFWASRTTSEQTKHIRNKNASKLSKNTKFVLLVKKKHVKTKREAGGRLDRKRLLYTAHELSWNLTFFQFWNTLRSYMFLTSRNPRIQFWWNFTLLNNFEFLHVFFHKEYGHTPKIQFGLIFMFFTVEKHFALLHVVF